MKPSRRVSSGLLGLVPANCTQPRPWDKQSSVVCALCYFFIGTFPPISPILCLYTWLGWCVFVTALHKPDWKGSDLFIFYGEPPCFLFLILLLGLYRLQRAPKFCPISNLQSSCWSLLNSFLNYSSGNLYSLSEDVSAYICIFPEIVKSLDSLLSAG